MFLFSSTLWISNEIEVWTRCIPSLYDWVHPYIANVLNKSRYSSILRAHARSLSQSRERMQCRSCAFVHFAKLHFAVARACVCVNRNAWFHLHSSTFNVSFNVWQASKRANIIMRCNTSMSRHQWKMILNPDSINTFSRKPFRSKFYCLFIQFIWTVSFSANKNTYISTC